MKHEELDSKNKQELKKIIIGYQLMVDKLKKEQEFLKAEIVNFESLQASRCCECERDTIHKFIDAYIALDTINGMVDHLEYKAEDLTPRAFQNYILGEFSKEIKKMTKIDN